MFTKKCALCGYTFEVKFKSLLRLKFCSKDCYKKSTLGKKSHFFKHGFDKGDFKFITKWHGMKGRCLNKKNIKYKDYGGRGIIICERWMEFENFKEDMYESYLEHVKKFGENKTTIGRINNNGNYEKTNCHWETPTEQSNNTRKNKTLFFNGEKHTISQWAYLIGIKPCTLGRRIRIGWPIEKALTTKLMVNQFR